jgi:hypothetical protein
MIINALLNIKMVCVVLIEIGAWLQVMLNKGCSYGVAIFPSSLAWQMDPAWNQDHRWIMSLL